ncbi:hypothetical protein GIB67_020822, partial [Kingdonia uniflora]
TPFLISHQEPSSRICRKYCQTNSISISGLEEDRLILNSRSSVQRTPFCQCLRLKQPQDFTDTKWNK